MRHLRGQHNPGEQALETQCTYNPRSIRLLGWAMGLGGHRALAKSAPWRSSLGTTGTSLEKRTGESSRHDNFDDELEGVSSDKHSPS
jgi:hypothetical protein